MWIRALIIITILVVGMAAMSHLNPSASKTLNPLLNGLANIRALFSQSPQSIPGAVDETETAENMEDQSRTVYKWRDKEGNWQFSNQAPTEDIATSVTVYRSDANVIQAVKPPEPEPETEVTEAESTPVDTPPPLVPIADPERVQKLMDDTRNIQNILDQRQEDMNKRLGDG